MHLLRWDLNISDGERERTIREQTDRPSRNLWHSCQKETSLWHLILNLLSSWSNWTTNSFTYSFQQKSLFLSSADQRLRQYLSVAGLLGQLRVAFCGSVLCYCWVLRHTVTLISENKEWPCFRHKTHIRHTDSALLECKVCVHNW